MYQTTKKTRWTIATTIVVLSTFLLCARSFSQETAESTQKGSQQREQLRYQKDDIEKGIEQLHNEIISKAKLTKDSFVQLKADTLAFSKRMDTLLDSDDGKRIACDPELLSTYNHLCNEPAITETDVATYLDRSSALLERVKIAEGHSEAKYLPTKETRYEIENLYAWGNDRSKRLKSQRDTLERIIERAPRDISLDTLPTLKKKLQELNAQGSIMHGVASNQAQLLTKERVQEILTHAYELKELEWALAEQKRLLEEARSENLRKETEMEIALTQLNSEWQNKLALAQNTFDEKMSELKRQLQDAQMTRKETESRFQIDMGVRQDTMTVEQMEAEAKSLEVRRLLTPFISKGCWQPCQSFHTSQPMPMSLNRMGAYQALKYDKNDAKYLNYLLGLGISPYNDRPHWTYPPHINRCSPQQKAEIVAAQKYLIRLGPTMVRLGMLSE